MLTTQRPSPIGEFLKCKKPENYFSKKELRELKTEYNTEINNRIWQAQELPSCKKASSILDGKQIMHYLLQSCDRTMLCYISFDEMAKATGMTNYRVRQLIKSMQEINILSYSKSSIQLLPVPKKQPSVHELHLRHYRERTGKKAK